MIEQKGGPARRSFSGVIVLALGIALMTLNPASVAAEILQPSRIHVVDGDTIDVDGARFRLVGYDTPETYYAKCDYELAWGDAATARLENLIGSGELVELVTLPGQDRYNRGLGRLYVGRLDVGEVLIAEGLARGI